MGLQRRRVVVGRLSTSTAPTSPAGTCRTACGCHVHTSRICRNDERCSTPPTSPEGGGRRPQAGGWGGQRTAPRGSPHPDLATLGRPSPSGRDRAHLAVIRHLKCVNRTAACGERWTSERSEEGG